MSMLLSADDAARLPSPPFIVVEGIPNFRDLGGYPIAGAPGKSIRREVIYRCGEPSKVTERGISTMQRLGVTHIYDLRSLVEIQRGEAAGRGGVVQWEGCQREFVPVFKDTDYSPEALAVRSKNYAAEGTEGYVQAYTGILQHGTSPYKTILSHVAHNPQKPLIIHCTAGKDRTGVICALMLSLCGVEDEIVANEYALTEIGLPSQWKTEIIEHLMQVSSLGGNMAGVLNMISARSANMLATLKMIKQKFGGAEQYIIEHCGLSKEDVERIRTSLISDEAPIHQEVPLIKKKE